MTTSVAKQSGVLSKSLSAGTGEGEWRTPEYHRSQWPVTDEAWRMSTGYCTERQNTQFVQWQVNLLLTTFHYSIYKMSCLPRLKVLTGLPSSIQWGLFFEPTGLRDLVSRWSFAAVFRSPSPPFGHVELLRCNEGNEFQASALPHTLPSLGCPFCLVPESDYSPSSSSCLRTNSLRSLPQLCLWHSPSLWEYCNVYCMYKILYINKYLVVL